ncbi:MAG: hypothetical protein Harvfovirus2_24 [Harvfovirus sp.]|uniref:Uncharacterized protein n=1 Tax=Harvfovirus sp. TaxID=2487768 RepID=A0A3G5A1X0_9VIRU|nr:MAG: hypothetical protein Harvfovirus2_24 [Harvfovirus sp.]
MSPPRIYGCIITPQKFFNWPLLVLFVVFFIPGITMIFYGVRYYEENSAYNKLYGSTTEYYVTWNANYFKQADGFALPDLLVERIPKVNNSLILCENVSSAILDEGYGFTQCVKDDCIEMGGCRPCDYVCVGGDCQESQGAEICASQMVLQGCSVIYYPLETSYACDNYPSDAVITCNETCSSIQCQSRSVCDCTLCTKMALQVYNFNVDNMVTKSGQFRYLADDKEYNSSEEYNTVCNIDDPNCNIYYVNLQGHNAEYTYVDAPIWGDMITSIDPLGIYYNINNPVETIGSLEETGSFIVLIIFGVITTLVALLILFYVIYRSFNIVEYNNGRTKSIV